MADTIQLKLNIDGKEAQTSLQNVNKDMSALEGSLAGMTETLSGIMRELDSKLGNLSGNISTLSLAINGMDSGADKSGSGLKEWGDGIENAGSMMSSLGTALSGTSGGLAAFGGVLSKISPWGMAAGSALQLLAPIFDTINEKSRRAAEEGMEQFREEVENLTSDEIKARLEDTKTKIDQINTKQNEKYKDIINSNIDADAQSSAFLGEYIRWLFSAEKQERDFAEQQVETLEDKNDDLDKQRKSYLGNLELQKQDLNIQLKNAETKEKALTISRELAKVERQISDVKSTPYKEERERQEAFLKQQEFNAKIKASNEAYQKDLAQIEKNGTLASSSLTLSHLEEKKKLYEEYGKSVVKINKDIQQAESELTKNAVKEFGSIKAAPLKTQPKKLEAPSSIEPVPFGDPQAYAQDWQKNWANREREELDMAEAAELKKADVYANAEEMKTAIHEKYSKYRNNIDKEEAQAQMDAAMGAMNFIGGAVGQNTVLGKAAAVANATMSTYEAAAKALTAGPIFGPILAGVITALGLANVSKILSIETPQMGGYAKGGIVVGEAGPEIIAPMQDYASGQALLVQQTVMEARRAMSSSQYAQASGDNQTLIRELQKLNSSFDGYSSRPITITKDAVGKIVSQGNSQLRKSRV
ncbi:MAG TPA: hypothetical protein VHP30_15930 [Ignavibacteriales bacterium]|nr:hypothetical protein [Ignavibacteriales bacterium]